MPGSSQFLLCSASPGNSVILLFSLVSQTFMNFSISTSNFSFFFRTNKTHQKRTEKPTTNAVSVPTISSFVPQQGNLQLIFPPPLDSICSYILQDLVYQLTPGLHLQPLLKQKQASFCLMISTSLLLLLALAVTRKSIEDSIFTHCPPFLTWYLFLNLNNFIL